MATYVIGDLHGCLDETLKLLNEIKYNKNNDRIFFLGDLVNGGKDSLGCLDLVYELSNSTNSNTVLGNHDLALLGAAMNYFPFPGNRKIGVDDILNSPDLDKYIPWLRSRPVFIDLPEFKYGLVHAGIHPSWDLDAVKKNAELVSTALQSDLIDEILPKVDETTANKYNDDLSDTDKVLYFINVFTKMRYLKPDLSLDFDTKEDPSIIETDYSPWFDLLNLDLIQRSILFGHWASLVKTNFLPKALCLDHGCVWGEELTALRLEDKKTFTISANK